MACSAGQPRGPENVYTAISVVVVVVVAMHVYLFSVHTPVLPLLYIGAWDEGGLQPYGVGSGLFEGTISRLYSDSRNSRWFHALYVFSVHTRVWVNPLPLIYTGAWNEGGLQPNGLGSCDGGGADRGSCDGPFQPSSLRTRPQVRR